MLDEARGVKEKDPVMGALIKMVQMQSSNFQWWDQAGFIGLNLSVKSLLRRGRDAIFLLVG